MKNFRKILLLLLVLILGLSLIACGSTEGEDNGGNNNGGNNNGGNNNGGNQTATMTISATSKALKVGETFTLTVTTSDNSAVTWSTSNPNVATVDGGVVTAIGKGTATITASSATAGSKTCTVTVSYADYYIIQFGGDADTPNAKTDPGKWYYWNDQNWVGSNVTVESAYFENGAVHVTWSSTGFCWHGLQLYYKNPELTVGTNYKLTMKIDSTVEGKITICGNVIDIVVGNNDIEVYMVQEADAQYKGYSVDIQMGSNTPRTMISAGSMVISDILHEVATTVPLKTPTALSIDSQKKVSITDDNGTNASAYRLYFYQSDQIKFVVDVQKDGTLDDTLIEPGTYTVKVQALGKGAYSNSEISSASTTYTDTTPVSYTVAFGGDQDPVNAQTVPGKWFYWNDQGWVGSNVTVSNATYNNGTLTFTWTSTGDNWFGLQFYYKNPALEETKEYKLTMTINSNTAGNITINGKVVSLVNGDNSVEVTFTQGGGYSISMQMGTSSPEFMLKSGTLTITNINFELVAS